MLYNTRNYKFLDFVHRPVFYKIENSSFNVSETGSVSVLRSGGRTPSQLGPLERGNLNHYFVEYWTMDKVQKLSNSE
jgi:hypothetical protein